MRGMQGDVPGNRMMSRVTQPAALVRLLFVVAASLALSACVGRTSDLPYAPPSFNAPPDSLFEQNPDYRLGPTDLVSITVFRAPELTGEYRVDASGNIVMPLIGQTQVLGMTTTEASAALRENLSRRYYVDPNVTVALREGTSQRVTVDERPVWRRACAQRLPLPVEQLRRRRSLDGDQNRQREADHRDAAHRLADAPEREDLARAPEQRDVGRAEGQRPRRRLRIDRRRSAWRWRLRAKRDRARDGSSVRRKRVVYARGQGNQLAGGRDEAQHEHRVEPPVGTAADRRTHDEDECSDAGEKGNGGPAIRAGEGGKRPADYEEEGVSRAIRRPLQRSSSCTDVRSTASSNTCSSRS